MLIDPEDVGLGGRVKRRYSYIRPKEGLDVFLSFYMLMVKHNGIDHTKM